MQTAKDDAHKVLLSPSEMHIGAVPLLHAVVAVHLGPGPLAVKQELVSPSRLWCPGGAGCVTLCDLAPSGAGLLLQ